MLHCPFGKAEDELIPADYANRLPKGKSALHVYRDLRGLSQAALAEKAGVNSVTVALLLVIVLAARSCPAPVALSVRDWGAEQGCNGQKWCAQLHL